MTRTLDDICQSGSFCNAFVYHICGMPWAATNSLELKEILDNPSPASIDLKRKLFGYGSYFDIQILPILQNNLGSQRIEYDESKGMTVGGWSVSLSSDPSGFVWKNGSDFEQWGILGLDWQPSESTQGVASTVLNADLVPDLDTNTVTLEWLNVYDNGLSDWMLDKWGSTSYSENLYIYTSSSCLRPITAPVKSNEVWTVNCETAQFNAPNEDIRAVKAGQNIFVTNYPQGIEGMTANLYGMQVADGELVEGAGFGHESFGHFPFGHTAAEDAGPTVTTGATPIFLRSGKVKANATTNNAGQWSVQMGGITDQFKFKADNSRFSGNIYGYEFNRTESLSLGGTVAYAPYDITVRENYTAGTSAVISRTLVNADRNSATDIQDLLEQIASSLNAWTSSLCTYSVVNGDIVWTEDTASTVDSVYITGTAVAAAGVGYVGYKRLPAWIKSLSDPITSNVGQSYITDQGEPDWFGGLPYDEIQLTDTYALCLRPKDVLEDEFIVGNVNSFEFGLIRNYGYFEYFIAGDNSEHILKQQNYTNNLRISEQVAIPVPENNAGSQAIYIAQDEGSEVELTAGDYIAFGGWNIGGSVYNIYGEVSYVSGDLATFTANTIYGMPSAFYYCKNLADTLNNNTVYRNQMQEALDVMNRIAVGGFDYSTVEEIVDLFPSDPFAVTEVTAAATDNPTAILKQLIGDPDTDVGIGSSMIQTSVKNVFQRGDDNFVPFVDWDTIDSKLLANKLSGAQFAFNSDKEVSWLSMLNGVLITHGLEMTYRYSETYKCWQIGAKLFNDGNLVSATESGSLVTDEDIAENEVQGIAGGGWYYTNIACSYNTTDGDKVNAGYKMRDGRIGHTLKYRTLTIKDEMTLLDMGDPANPVSVLEGTIYPEMLRQFATVVYKQSLALKMTKAARIGVGGWTGAEWDPLLYRSVGRRGAGKLVGEVSAIEINLTNNTYGIDIMTTQQDAKGIGPTLNIDTSTLSSSTVTITGISKDVNDNEYADPASGFTDLAGFGCFENVAGNIQSRGCECDGYRVTVFERNTEELYFDSSYVDTNQNVWRGRMSVIDVDDITGTGTTTATIVLDGNADKYDTAKQYAVIFASRNSALEPCQIELYGWLGDSNGKVLKDDATYEFGIKVGA